MCGIVGLLLKRNVSRSLLGTWVLPMFDCMSERGPDSAGLAVFGEPTSPELKRYNLYVPRLDFDWHALAEKFRQQTKVSQCQVDPCENHAVFTTTMDSAAFRSWLKECDPSPHLLSVGKSIDVYKDEGIPSQIARRYHFSQLSGSHCVGHTRMATESAVSPAHAHPFTAGEDFCLVHNGSLSNPYMLRRKLEGEGLTFETDNDTEAACRFIEWRLRQGDTVERALQTAFAELDGFYTLLIASADRLILVRDAFACKPAIVAETDQYVAVSSEFRSLAHLPGIQQAKIFEPQPEEIHAWSV